MTVTCRTNNDLLEFSRGARNDVGRLVFGTWILDLDDGAVYTWAVGPTIQKIQVKVALKIEKIRDSETSQIQLAFVLCYDPETEPTLALKA